MMESLWMETFGDSPEYVELIFDHYFSPDRVVYKTVEGRVVSGLLGVPYSFGQDIKGLYLCGLSTRKESRRRGLMSGLIEKINLQAKSEGFDFTFLKPANDGLRKYYEDRHYHDTFFKIKEHYVRGHRFTNEEPLDVTTFSPGDDMRERIIGYLLEREKASSSNGGFNLIHSRKDWEAVLDESVISNEPTKYSVKDGKIMAVGFIRELEEGTRKKTIEVKSLFVTSEEMESAFLKGLEKEYPESNITIVRNIGDVEPGKQLWQPFYAQNNAKKAEYEDIAEVEQPFEPSLNSYPFGMVRVFDVHSLMKKAGIEDCEALHGYSDEELVKILLRRPVFHKGEDSLETLLDLPSLRLNASLVLE